MMGMTGRHVVPLLLTAATVLIFETLNLVRLGTFETYERIVLRVGEQELVISPQALKVMNNLYPSTKDIRWRLDEDQEPPALQRYLPFPKIEHASRLLSSEKQCAAPNRRFIPTIAYGKTDALLRFAVPSGCLLEETFPFHMEYVWVDGALTLDFRLVDRNAKGFSLEFLQGEQVVRRLQWAAGDNQSPLSLPIEDLLETIDLSDRLRLDLRFKDLSKRDLMPGKTYEALRTVKERPFEAATFAHRLDLQKPIHEQIPPAITLDTMPAFVFADQDLRKRIALKQALNLPFKPDAIPGLMLLSEEDTQIFERALITSADQPVRFELAQSEEELAAMFGLSSLNKATKAAQNKPFGPSVTSRSGTEVDLWSLRTLWHRLVEWEMTEDKNCGLFLSKPDVERWNTLAADHGTLKEKPPGGSKLFASLKAEEGRTRQACQILLDTRVLIDAVATEFFLRAPQT